MSHFPTDDELRAVFDDYSMGDGSLDREEFKRMCYKYYIAPTYKDVDEVFKELDKNSDEKLTFDEVKNYIAANWKPILDSQNQFLEDLQSCRKKDGPITRDELREILQQPGEEALTDEDIDEIFQLIDLNDDNEISVDEISKLLFNIEAVSRAVSRCESRRSRGRKKSRSRSRSSSKGRKRSKSRDRKRSKSRSKSRDRRRSKSRSKSRDRKRSKSRSKSRDRKRSRSNERKRSGSRGRKRSSSRGSRHSGSAGSHRGGSGHGRGYEISQGVVSGEAETVSEVVVQNAEAPEQSNQEQTQEQKPETNEQSNVNNEQSNQEQVEAQNPETTEQSNVNNEQSNQEAESGNDKKDDTTEQNDAQQIEENKPEKTEDTSEQKAE